MHSKHFYFSSQMVLLIALVAVPSTSYALDPPTGKDVKGSAAIANRIEDLLEQKASIEEKIESTKNDKGIKSEYTRDAILKTLRDALRPVDSEIALQKRRNKSAARKFGKIERDEETAETLKAEIIELIGTMDGKSPEEILEIQTKIQAKREEMSRLGGRVDRKEGGYERRAGVEAPVRCKEKELRDPETNTCLPEIPCAVYEVKSPDGNGCSTKDCGEGKIVDRSTGGCIARPGEEELKKRPECWTRDEKPFSKKLSTTFPVGEDGLVGKDGSGIANSRSKSDSQNVKAHQAAISNLFDQQVAEFYQTNGNQSEVRFYKIEATSHASRIRMKSFSSEVFANTRSDGAVNAFFTSLALNHGEVVRPISEDFSVEKSPFSAESPVEIGPKWIADHKDQLGRRPSDAEIRKAAEKMANGAEPYGRDPSPVIISGDVEATYSNLKACCSASLYNLRYQPYQYSELTIYGERFTPKSEACAGTWNKVSTSTGEKNIPSDQTGATPVRESDSKKTSTGN